MYEDLQAGGEAAKAVLSGLAKGPTGEGEESECFEFEVGYLDLLV